MLQANLNAEARMAFDKIVHYAILKAQGEMSLDTYETLSEIAVEDLNRILTIRQVPQDERDSLNRKIRRCKKAIATWIAVPEKKSLTRARAWGTVQTCKLAAIAKINRIIP